MYKQRLFHGVAALVILNVVLLGLQATAYLSNHSRSARAGKPGEAPEEIRAQKFTLVDPSGRVVGTFGVDKGRTAMWLGNARNGSRVAFGATHAETGVFIYDGQGTMRAGLTYIPEEDASLSMIKASNGHVQWIAPNGR